MVILEDIENISSNYKHLKYFIVKTMAKNYQCHWNGKDWWMISQISAYYISADVMSGLVLYKTDLKSWSMLESDQETQGFKVEVSKVVSMYPEQYNPKYCTILGLYSKVSHCS